MSATKQDTPKGNKRQQKATQSKTTKTRAASKSNQIITAPEALQLLESAVSYCQQAGLNVNAANREDGILALFIPRARYIVTNNGGAVFVLNEFSGL